MSPISPTDDSHSKRFSRNRKLGRLNGINRYGEENIHPGQNTFEDEGGMKHPYDRHYNTWTSDIRSEGAGEKNFFGRGPKGYKRPDGKIREEVCETLTQDPMIDPSGIEVSVSEGLVTLEGIVNSKNDRNMIVDMVEDVPGVRAVHNHLAVRKHVEGWIPNISSNDEYRDQGLSDFVKGLY